MNDQAAQLIDANESPSTHQPMKEPAAESRYLMQNSRDKRNN